MANCIVSRLGELIRAAVMSIKGEMRTSTALASIALERVFDVCTVVVFLILALQWLGPSSMSAANAETLKRLTGAKAHAGRRPGGRRRLPGSAALVPAMDDRTS